MHTTHIEIEGVVIDEPPTAFQLGRIAEVKEAAHVHFKLLQRSEKALTRGGTK